MNKQSYFRTLITVLSFGIFTGLIANRIFAADIVKANNADPLNLTTSWIGGAVPGASDVAVWNSTVSDPNNTTNTLGASTNWAGLKVLNPVASLTVTTNGSGAVLTLGASGIDMSAASQSLTLSNATALLGATTQPWLVGSGVTLALGGPLTRNAQATVDFDTSAGGTINISSGTALSALNYATVNKTDLAALDASKNVTSGASVLTYTPNATGTGANTASMSGTFAVIDVVNSNPAGAPSAFRLSNTATVTSCIRFNTPNSNNIDWVIDANSRNLNFGGATMLITANVGAHNVIEQDSATGFRFSGGGEMIIAQHNTNGDFVVNGHITANGTGIINITKTGAGRFILNSTGNGILPMAIEQGTILVNNVISSASTATVNNGAVFGGVGTAGNVVVANGGTLLPGQNGSGAAGVLTLNNSLTLNPGTTALNFYSPSIPTTNTSALLVINSNLVVNSSQVNVLIKSGKASVGQYPLIKWTNAISAPVFSTFNLAAMPPHVLGYLSNNVAAFTVDLVVTNVNEPLKWATGSGTWNIGTTANWQDTFGASTTYQESGGVGDSVVFEDSVSGASPITVTLNASPIPASVDVSNITKNYTVSGSGNISGSATLTKQGAGALTLGTANTFTGGINLNGGVVSFSTLPNLGAGAINFGGGTLQFASGNAEDISARTVTFNSGGATIDVGANSVYLNNPIGNNGAGGLVKTGGGTLTLNGTNRYAGNTVISLGTLAFGSGTTFISNSPAIIVNGGTTLDVAAVPAIVLRNQILAGSGTINGGVTVPSGSTISPGTNGVIATLAIGGTSSGDLTVNGGALAMDVTSSSRDLITVNGNLSISAGSLLVITNSTPLPNGVYRLITYTGALLTGSGSSGNLTIVGFSQPNKSASLTDTLNPNEIDLVIADTASDTLTWSGTGTDWDTIGSLDWLNGGTPWAYTNGDIVTFDEIGIASPIVSLKAALSPRSLIVSNQTATYMFTDGTGTGGGKVSGPTVLTKNGPGTLLIETANNNSGGLLINNGTVQVGDGGSIVGDIGTGNVTNNGALIFAPPTGDTRTVASISGTGTIEKQGAGTTIAAANNSYTGLTTITTGTLQIGNGGSTGTLGAAGVVDNGALSFNRTGSLSVPNSISGIGSLAVNGGGTITLAASNNYIGGTLVNSGKLIVGNANAISGLGNLSVQAAGTNDLNGNNLTISRLNSALSAGGRLVNNSGSATNVLTIDYDGTGAADSSVVIADNDGTGGRVRLVKNGTGTQILRSASTYSGGTIINAGALQARSQNNAFGTATNVILNGGVLQNFSSTLGYTIETWADSGLETSGNCTFTGPLISTNNLTATIDGGNVTMSWGAANQMSAFTGRMTVQGNATSSFFRWTTSPNGSALANWDLEGDTSMTVNGTGFTISLGSLEGASTASLQGNNTTYLIGAKNTNTTFSGTVGGTTAVNLVKVGTATLTLNGSITAPGNTTVSNGVLALVEPVSLDTDTTIAVRSGGTLDVTGRADTTLNLGTGATVQTLTGAGTVAGNVNQGASGVINPGDGIGKLNVSGTLTLAGTNIFELNRTNSAIVGTNDMMAVTGAITVSGGTLIATNLGPELITGNTFKLFNKPVNGLTTSLPVSNALNTVQYVWQDNLASDGTITLLQGASPVNTTPTNIVTSVSGNTLTLTWPADHTGWRLQVQTNTVNVGLRSNWVDVAGSTSVNTMNFTLDPANGSVFFRMVYP
jgi:fibronectin-binding autotransporter adhesin